MNPTEQLLFLSRSLHGASDLSDALESVNAFISAHTRYRACWAVLRTQDGKHLDLIGNPLPNMTGVHQRMGSLLLEKDALLRHLFTAVEPFCIPDLRLEPQADPAQVAHFGSRTLIVVPMLPFGGRVGAMLVGTFADRGVMEPTDAEFDLIVRVASLLTLVVSRTRAEERARAAAERSQANQRLESLGRMAGEVAHDFNNIITAISGNADLALSELEQHPAREFIQEIQAASQRASELSRQLLTFSKGQLLQPTALDLGEVMEGLARMLSRLMPRNIELSFRTASGLPPILAERSQVEQLVMNLVLNARDAMPEGGELRVHTSHTTLHASQLEPSASVEPGQFLCISVQDSGGGIPEHAQAQIFEPFFSTKGSSQGTGLGLSVVRSVVQKHKGHLHFSTSQSGTTFFSYFPTTDLEPQAMTILAQSTGRTPNELVLVADDQPQIRTLLGRVLKRAGYQVEVCGDGEQAMRFIQANPQVAVVLSDVTMPKMGGLELLAQLQDRAHPPPVVLMSGYTPDQDLPHSAHILNKPFRMDELLLLLDKVLEPSAAPSLR